MSKFKPLYEFTIPLVKAVKEETKSTNEDGAEVVTTQTVKKSVPQPLCLKKPTRSLENDSIIYYAAEVGKRISLGLLSAVQLDKRLKNDGGVLSNVESKTFDELLDTYWKKQEEFSILVVKTESERSEEENATLKTLGIEIAKLNNDIQVLQNKKNSLFDITAEAQARNLVIVWWLLALLYQKNDKGEWIPFFKGGNHQEREASLESLEDDDLEEEQSIFNSLAFAQAYKATALWYYRRPFNQEEFEKGLAELEKNSSLPDEEPEVVESND